MMRRAGCLLAPALLLLALSCGDGNSEVPREITPDDLASIAPPAEEVGEVLGVARPEFEARPGELGQEFEGVDTETYGLVAAYVAVYAASEMEPGVGMTLALFETADGASGSLRDILERLEGEVDSEFDLGDGADEGRGLLFPTSPDEPRITTIALRVDRLVGFIFVLNPDGEEMRAEARELAKKVVENIDELGKS